MSAFRTAWQYNRRLAMWLGCSIVLIDCLSHATAAEPPPTMRTIRDAWAARQNLLTSVCVEWRTAIRHSKTPICPQDVPRLEIPMTDLTYGFEASLLLSESMMRYAGRTLSIAADRSVTPIDYVSAADGDLSTNMMFGEGRPPLATVFREKLNTDRISGPLMPILMFLRPASKEYPLMPQTLEILHADILYDTVSCVMIGDRSNRYWLDPARSFVIIRWEAFHSKLGWPTHRANVSYKQDPKLGWVPSTWSLDTFMMGDPVPMTTTHCSVTKLECDIRTIKQEFQIVFPPATRVYDQRSNKRYIILPDGTHSPE